METKSSIYKVVVDRSNPQSAIDQILDERNAAIKQDFANGVNDDGSVPRGLISDIARRYNMTSGGVSKLLQRAGLLRQCPNQSVINPSN